MNNEFISYEQALELKELGFNENCFAHFVKHYNEIKCILNSDDFDEWWTNNSDNLECKAPLYQQAFRWFREKYGLHSLVEPVLIEDNDQIMYDYMVLEKDGMKEEYNNIPYSSYDEAQIACLDKLIEIVKNK
jgi:hypothetical protein